MVSEIQLLTWMGCQNCQTTAKMSFAEWHEKVKEGICPVGDDVHLGLCAKMLCSKLDFSK